MQSTKAGSSNSKTMAIAIIALVVAIGSAAYVFVPHTSASSPTKREFYIATPENSWNVQEAGLANYTYTHTQLMVNQGDDVVIHFYNTADDTHHTFTLSAYNINVDLAPGQHQDIEFTATSAGIFQYYCTYHPTTMRGELVVLSG